MRGGWAENQSHPADEGILHVWGVGPEGFFRRAVVLVYATCGLDKPQFPWSPQSSSY